LAEAEEIEEAEKGMGKSKSSINRL